MTHKIHTHYMQYALRLGARNLGVTAKNPAVGCVLVNNGHVVGVGYTHIGGRPHAETQAIAMAGNLCRGASAYVTLEPCAHVGHTPSCAESLVTAGISTCYIATSDCDSRTNGRGVKILQNAGIRVHVGLCKQQAQQQHMGFFLTKTHNRPLVTVKIATSIDGKIALINRQSKWITNEKSRQYGQYLRSTHDAILVGANTVRWDNPSLTCRLHGMQDLSPVRIILGNNIPDTSTVLTDAGKTHILSGDIPYILQKITDLGGTRLLIEGGANTITQFIQSGFVDHIAHFQAPKIMGADSISVISRLNITNMIDIPTYNILTTKILGDDIFTLYGKK